jgi:hypothetical protein
MADSDTTAPRTIGRPFQPGQSGNPSGPKKGVVARVRELLERPDPADPTAPKDLWEWYDAIRRGKVPGFGGRERMEAAKRLEERAHGKVSETHVQIQAEADQVEGAAELAGDALAELARALSSEDPDPSGGTDGGTRDVTPRAA